MSDTIALGTLAQTAASVWCREKSASVLRYRPHPSRSTSPASSILRRWPYGIPAASASWGRKKAGSSASRSRCVSVTAGSIIVRAAFRKSNIQKQM